jgi:hypothetical protein
MPPLFSGPVETFERGRTLQRLGSLRRPHAKKPQAPKMPRVPEMKGSDAFETSPKPGGGKRERQRAKDGTIRETSVSPSGKTRVRTRFIKDGTVREESPISSSRIRLRLFFPATGEVQENSPIRGGGERKRKLFRDGNFREISPTSFGDRVRTFFKKTGDRQEVSPTRDGRQRKRLYHAEHNNTHEQSPSGRERTHFLDSDTVREQSPTPSGEKRTRIQFSDNNNILEESPSGMRRTRTADTGYVFEKTKSGNLRVYHTGTGDIQDFNPVTKEVVTVFGETGNVRKQEATGEESIFFAKSGDLLERDLTGLETITFANTGDILEKDRSSGRKRLFFEASGDSKRIDSEKNTVTTTFRRTGDVHHLDKSSGEAMVHKARFDTIGQSYRPDKVRRREAEQRSFPPYRQGRDFRGAPGQRPGTDRWRPENDSTSSSRATENPGLQESELNPNDIPINPRRGWTG